jgi:RNA polymerase sigma-70 factor (ECF subfamily)
VPTEIEQLYREHRARLVRLVERELHDHHDAEDVVQTAFLDAQRALERGTIPHNPRAWLAAIALNAARRLRRRRLDAGPLEDFAVQEASGVSEIHAALTSLPREQRAAVLYRDVLGLSYDETAEQMGRSVNAVTMLLHRGRKRLRQTLGVTVGGVGSWRWVKQAGVPQAAVVKGAAAVVASAGLATAGVVAAGRAAQVADPIRADTTVALATRSGSLTAGAGRTPDRALALGSVPRHSKASEGSRASTAPTSTQGPNGDATPTPVRSSTAAAVVPSLATSMLRVPTVLRSTLPIPTLPTTVAATLTVITPITAATVTTPMTTTATVTTPLTTVTVPVP